MRPAKSKFNRGTGVIIPAQNRQHLMLRDEIITAVQQGQFHIYSIATVDEGLELLSGLPAGALRKTGPLPRAAFTRRSLRSCRLSTKSCAAKR